MKKSAVVPLLQRNGSSRFSVSEGLRSERVKSYIGKTHERFVSSLKHDHSAVTVSGSGVLAGSIRKKPVA